MYSHYRISFLTSAMEHHLIEHIHLSLNMIHLHLIKMSIFLQIFNHIFQLPLDIVNSNFDMILLITLFSSLLLFHYHILMVQSMLNNQLYSKLIYQLFLLFKIQVHDIHYEIEMVFLSLEEED
jgi:hypothetical protein